MKKILIVNKSFEVGGIQSSMINMANELSKYYEVHLFLYNPKGILKERLDSKIKIIEPSWRFQSIGESLRGSFKTKNFKIIAFRIFATIWSKLFSNRLPINLAIKHQGKLTGYDLAIAYHQEQRKKSVVSGFSRMVDQCVQAKRKVAWLHYDFDTVNLDSQYNNQFYQKLDKVVCVSKSLRDNFIKKYPELREKADYCYNFMAYEEMKEKSKREQDIVYSVNKFICFSACRLAKVKAVVRAVYALSDVLKKNRNVVWYIAGDGPERNNIEEAIKANCLEQQIVLIGNQSNPYPYIRNANLVLNVSYHEAAPMIFLESKALGTPVFATRTSSAEELLQNKVDSFICENSEEGIRDMFTWIVENKEKVENAKLQLANYCASNEDSLAKIKEFLG